MDFGKVLLKKTIKKQQKLECIDKENLVIQLVCF